MLVFESYPHVCLAITCVRVGQYVMIVIKPVAVGADLTVKRRPAQRIKPRVPNIRAFIQRNSANMVLTLHHLGLSQSERIIWLAEELGLDYKYVHHKRDPISPRNQ
jgi:hypothetical protein